MRITGPKYPWYARHLRFYLDGVDLTDTLCVRAFDTRKGWIEMLVVDHMVEIDRDRPIQSAPNLKQVPYYKMKEDKSGPLTETRRGRVTVRFVWPGLKIVIAGLLSPVTRRWERAMDRRWLRNIQRTARRVKAAQ